MSQEILNVISEAVLVVNGDGMVEYINQAAATMAEKTPREAMGMPLKAMWPALESALPPTRLQQILQSGQAQRSEIAVAYRGEEHWLHTRIQVFRAGTGSAGAVLITGSDITEFKAAVTALQESEERFRQFSEAAFEGLAITRKDKFLDFNRRFAEMFGYQRQELLQKTVLELVAPESRRELQHHLRHRAEAVFELQAVRRNGTQFPVELQMRSIPYKNASARITAVRDITERRHSAEMLLQSQKMESIGLLAGGIAHDFNNLLNVILGQTSLALRKLTPLHSAYLHIEKSIQAVEKAADLTRQLLAYSGRGKFEVRVLDLNEMIQKNTRIFEFSVPSHIRIATRPHHEQLLVQADPGQLQQVMLNLLINSVEAIGDKPGEVVIAVGSRSIQEDEHHLWLLSGTPLSGGVYATVEVSDNGCGMDPEIQRKCLDPFFTTKFSGRGLGLPAVLGIVRSHRGAMTLQSEPGQGTTVQIYLPILIDTARLQELSAEAGRGVIHAGRAVLVIDDEEMVLDLVRDILEEGGMKLMTAADGEAGIRLYQERRHEIGLVLLDLSMPRMDGVATLRELRRIDPQVKVLLTSGYTEEDVSAKFAGLELAGFIQKPYQPASLLGKLREHLG